MDITVGRENSCELESKVLNGSEGQGFVLPKNMKEAFGEVDLESVDYQVCLIIWSVFAFTRFNTRSLRCYMYYMYFAFSFLAFLSLPCLSFPFSFCSFLSFTFLPLLHSFPPLFLPASSFEIP